MAVLRLVAGVLLMAVLATVVLAMLAVTWSPGFVMRTMAPRWGRWVCWVGGVRLEVEGREHLARQAVIAANHQSALEVFILPAVLPPKVRYVGKREVARIPFFGWAFRATGQILVDRADPPAAIAAIDASLAHLPNGVSVFVAAEGTRSPDGTLGSFKKGAFHIALKLGVPIVPMTIDGAHLLLPKYGWLPRPGTVRVRFSPPVDTSGWTAADLDARVAEVRGTIARELEQMRAQRGALRAASV